MRRSSSPNCGRIFLSHLVFDTGIFSSILSLAYMIINKITPGYVIQQFDTDLDKWIKQEFFAHDEGVTYENELGDELEFTEIPFKTEKEPYLPFIMDMPK